MSASTPVSKRMKLGNEGTQSPLGMLAALASPSPPIKIQTQSHSTSQPAFSGNVGTPKLESGFLEYSEKPASKSASPLYSPSTRAAKRKTQKIEQTPESSTARPDQSPTQATGDTLPRMAGTHSSASSVHAGSPKPPSAIPATQLDVLALVTATSPPMPSQHRWEGHSTPKPAFPRDNECATPTKRLRESPPSPSVLRESRTGNDSKGGNSSDTVSEDESQLRSHSSRLRSRYHSARLRTLPGLPPMQNGSSRTAHRFSAALPYTNAGNRPQSEHALRVRPRFFAPNPPPLSDMAATNAMSAGARLTHSRVHASKDSVAGQSSDGEATSTDEEPFPHSLTPAARRVPASHTTHILAGSAAPASEPALRRRMRQHMDVRPLGGTAFSRQLSELTEEAEEGEGEGSRNHVIHQLRDLSASLSPLPSPSQPRRQRTRRVLARRASQQSGSETETDNECTGRRNGPEAEAGQALSASSNDGSAVNGRLSLDRPRRIVNRSQHTGVVPCPPYGPSSHAPLNGQSSPESVHSSQQARLPSVEQLGGQAPHQNLGPSYPQPAQSRVDIDSDATETDDEFFGPSRAVHYSIRPPRRVVRQLASLRSRHPQPTPFSLYGQQLPYQSPTPDHPHTAPASGSVMGASSSFGLGIVGSNGAHRDDMHPGPARTSSTPMLAAAPALAFAVGGRHAMPPSPQISPEQNSMAAPAAQAPCHQPAGDYRTSPLHNSSMRREFSRDPFAPMPDELTYKGAALRRLERSSHRGAATSCAQDSSTSRKRALTAPSSFDPPPLPGRKAVVYGPESNNGHSFALATRAAGGRARHGDACCPENHDCDCAHASEHRRHIGNRSSLLGVSPVSSLRSSLFARAEPSAHQQPRKTTTDSARASTGPKLPLKASQSDVGPIEASDQSRKRRHSSATARLPLQQQQTRLPSSGLSALSSPEPTDELSPLALSPSGAATANSPRTNDTLFPPIDSGTS